MIRTQGVPALREDSFDWLSRTLAQVLGTGAAATPLRRDRPLRDMTANESAVFAETLRRRYRRVEDPRTGRVSYVRAGGLTALGPDGGDPMLEWYAATFLPPVREALERIVPTRGRGADIAEEVAAALAGLREALALYENELRSPPSPAYLAFLGDEVADDLEDLRALIAPSVPDKGPADVDDLGEAADRAAIAAATAALGALRAAVEGRIKELGGPLLLDAFFREVERAAPMVAEAAEEVRRLFAAIGVAEAELTSYAIDAGSLRTLSDLLRATAEEPRLWLALARTGSGQHRDRIEHGACAILNGLTVLAGRLDANPTGFLKGFGLAGEECCDDGRVLLGAVERLCRLGLALLRPLCPEARQQPSPPRLPRLTRLILRPTIADRTTVAASSAPAAEAPSPSSAAAAAAKPSPGKGGGAKSETSSIPKP